MPIKWPIIVDLRWCPNCNVPVIGGRCSKCGGPTTRLKVPPPGDARLALKPDIERIDKTLKELFNISLDKITKNKDAILLVKEPYIDERRQIIASGHNIGSLYFNPFLSKDLFRPSKLLTYRLIADKLIDYIHIEHHVGDIVSINREEDILIGFDGKNAFVLDKIRDGKFRVRAKYEFNNMDREFEKYTEVENKKSNLSDLIKANEDKIYEYLSRSEAFLYSMISKVEKPIVVSFSGGKDSLVVLHITLDLGVEPEVVFNNTGIELPETIDTVEKVIEKYGLELKVADAGDKFWRAVEVYGPPARNYRWCCKVVKLVPFAMLAKRAWPQGALNILGQRAFESFDRARSPRVWRNRWVPHVLSIAPIQEWPQLLLWIHIIKSKLIDQLNPLYFKGFERIGCYLCPASTLYEFKVISQTHPELWNKWINILKEHGCNDVCIRLGLWRWLGPASTKKQLASKYGIRIDWKEEYTRYVRSKIINYKRVTIGNREVYVVEFEHKLPSYRILSQYSVLGLRSRKENIAWNKDTTIVIHRNKIIVSTKNKNSFEVLLDVLKITYRGIYCVQCGSCTLWCPTKAIAVSTYPIVDPRKCISCRICLHECPLAELIVDKIISSILLNRYDGWRREGKTKRKDVINIIKLITVKVSEEERKRAEYASRDYDVTYIDNFDKY